MTRADLIKELKLHIITYYNGSQTKMAEQIGIHYSTISKVVKGKIAVPPSILNDMGMECVECYALKTY